MVTCPMCDAVLDVEEDELVEVTPVSIRLRKQALTENERKKQGRKKIVTEVEA